jgi:hypothetical protein
MNVLNYVDRGVIPGASQARRSRSFSFRYFFRLRPAHGAASRFRRVAFPSSATGA